MKAAVYDHVGGPEVLRYEEVPDPQVRASGLVIEVRAIGLQGGDLINRRQGALADKRHIVGYQASGIVRQVGERVEDFAPGDRVVAMMMHGSHAELASVPAHKTWHIPDVLSFEDAAAVPVEFGTAADALFEFGRVHAGEAVLVQGAAGGVGLAAIQLARTAGATVIATARGEDRIPRLAELGAHHTIDSSTHDVAAEVRAITENHGADLVVDPVGGRILEASVDALAYRGRISWVGNAGGSAHRPDLWPLMEKNGQLNVLFLAMEQSRQPDRTHRMVASLLERVGSGELRAVIDQTFPLSDAAAAHHYAETQPVFGRVILVP